LIDTLHLDLTSYNKTFNSLSPQGQWFCSRIGKRNYPIQECDFNLLKEFITENTPKKVFCNSFYGDSLEYSNIVNLSKLCKELDIEFMIFTYGSNLDTDLIQTLLDNNSSFYLFSYGIENNTDSVVSNINWDSIHNFLKQTKNKTIIEYVGYQHNLIDLLPFLKICKQNNNSIKITKGNTFEGGVKNVFNEKGNWLHDVIYVTDNLPYENVFLHDVTEAIATYRDLNLQHKNLYRTTLGFMSLRYFLKNDEGQDIFNIRVPDRSSEYKLDLDYNNEVFINFTGHVFCSRESFEVFNNCLCNDWDKKAQQYIVQTFNGFLKDKHGKHQKDKVFMDNVLLKNLFYYNKNHEDCILEKNIKKFYWN
jgi:hypothetical protein